MVVKLAYFAWISHILVTLGIMVHDSQITMHSQGAGDSSKKIYINMGNLVT